MLQRIGLAHARIADENIASARQVLFRRAHRVSILAVARDQRVYYGGFLTMTLKAGDTVLIYGTGKYLEKLAAGSDLVSR